MHTVSFSSVCLGTFLLFTPPLAPAVEQIPENHARQVERAAPMEARVLPHEPRRVLIWNTPDHLMQKDPHKGYCIPYGAAALRILGIKTGAYEPVVSQDLALMLPENIEQFDAIVLNNSSGSWISPTDADLAKDSFKRHGADKITVEQVLRNSLLDFVRNGRGIVCLHYAIAANPTWPEFGEMIGAKFTGHPWNEEIGVRVEEPGHPLVAAFGGNNFRIADEIYEYGAPYDRGQLRVLLSLDPATSNLGVKWIQRKDNDFALAWVKSYGEGRIFNTSFGHRTEIFWDPRVLQFYLDAIQFACGDLPAATEPRADDPERGFVSIFNGEDLSGWEGDASLWSVRNGVITGETTETQKVKENSFLIWKGGQPENFELRLKYKLLGGNSGIYFHAEKRREGAKGEPLVGPQADFSADHRWTGVLMEYTKREVLAERGQRVFIDENGVKKVTGTVGDPTELLKQVRDAEWNDYEVFVRGETVILRINGAIMCEVTDRDARRTPQGFLALQVHTGPPMTVQFKDIRIRQY